MGYLDDSLAQVEVFEGIIAWMYRDTKGFVTVGVGELLASAGRAEALAFVDGNSNPVSQAMIAAEYGRVLALPAARPAGFYRTTGSPVLTHATVEELLMQHLVFFDGQLSGKFTNYAQFPEPAKLALLDMIFNLGVTGLFQGFPTLMRDAQSEDWAGAAAQSHRNGPSQERNDWTRQQFLAAAGD